MNLQECFWCPEEGAFTSTSEEDPDWEESKVLLKKKHPFLNTLNSICFSEHEINKKLGKSSPFFQLTPLDDEESLFS